MRVSAYVDAVACQLPLLREKEGRGPIAVEAGEGSTTTVMLTLYSIMVQPDKDIVIQDNI